MYRYGGRVGIKTVRTLLLPVPQPPSPRLTLHPRDRASCIPSTFSPTRPLPTPLYHSTMSSTGSSQAAIGLLFCGQGAQTVGMTRAQMDIPAVSHMYDVANEVLGYDLKQIVLEGPDETLNDTRHAQPALLIAGLAAVEQLRRDDPDALDRVNAVAGLSLGEYTALVHAGAMSFEDAIRVVGVRARAMQEAGKAAPGTMATVINMDDKALNEAVARVAQTTGETINVANLLFPKGRVVGGSPNAVKALMAAVKTTSRVIVKELKVSGAFHTALMSSAQTPLAEALATAEITMPSVPVVANTTGKTYTTVDEIRSELVRQIVTPVQWEASIHAMIDGYASTLYDMGPRQTIKPMIRKISPAVGKNTVSIDV
eukprot:m.182483 g.182483  ORF g.182483 m.182483 type:complete len:370 (+) comp15539_c0_seq1:32-1141(+)